MRRLGVAALLAAAVLVVFWPVLGHDFVNFDDNRYVTENPWVQRGLDAGAFRWAWTTTSVANWHPLTWLSHMLDVTIFGMRAGGPLHVVSLGDAAATNVYVASDTGDIVLKTDRSSRFWGYAGPVMHWFYFRPLRVKSDLWYNLIVYGSVVGCIISIIGLVIGVYRYSLSRLRAGMSATPYAGWLRWHLHARCTAL